MDLRARLMRILQDEAELEEIVKLVGMDALSAPDRLKLEAARSIREDFLHQNAFHETDTYTSLEKQHDMMLLVVHFYDQCVAALDKGAKVDDLIALPVREKIGRFKSAQSSLSRLTKPLKTRRTSDAKGIQNHTGGRRSSDARKGR